MPGGFLDALSPEEVAHLHTCGVVRTLVELAADYFPAK
jgi:hypothetical protein